ncbi:cold shock domain-containing protein 3-like protein [Tanacetum coccineum]
MDVSGRRESGTVTWFDNGLKCGHIKPANGGEEVFVHQSSVRSDVFMILTVGLRVEYVALPNNTRLFEAFDVTGVTGGGEAFDLPLFDSGKTGGGVVMTGEGSGSGGGGGNCYGGTGEESGGKRGGSRESEIVTWFDKGLKCGHIKPANGGDVVFVHQSSVRSDVFMILSVGLLVEYVAESNNTGGFEAFDVTGVGGGGEEIDVTRVYDSGKTGGGVVMTGEESSCGGGSYYGGSGVGQESGGTSGGVTDNFGFWNGVEYCTDEVGNGGGGGGCYNCGLHDHFARNCPTLNIVCYQCFNDDHLASDYPVIIVRRGRRGGGGGGRDGV